MLLILTTWIFCSFSFFLFLWNEPCCFPFLSSSFLCVCSTAVLFLTSRVGHWALLIWCRLSFPGTDSVPFNVTSVHPTASKLLTRVPSNPKWNLPMFSQEMETVYVNIRAQSSFKDKHLPHVKVTLFYFLLSEFGKNGHFVAFLAKLPVRELEAATRFPEPLRGDFCPWNKRSRQMDSPCL